MTVYELDPNAEKQLAHIATAGMAAAVRLEAMRICHASTTRGEALMREHGIPFDTNSVNYVRAGDVREAYLNLYPNGARAQWLRNRMAREEQGYTR